MLLYYLTYFFLIVVQGHHTSAYDHDEIISLSTVLGAQLLFDTEVLDQFSENEDFTTLIWSKGIHNQQPLVDGFLVSPSSRFQLIDRTKLFITHTSIGDEGFYTLNIQTHGDPLTTYLFHVILFSPNLTLALSPSSFDHQAGQSINFTCFIVFFANRTYIEQHRSIFSATWSMILYNHDPDQYQLLDSSSTSYTYIASLLHYEFDRNDHNQTISCALIEQQSEQIVIHNKTLQHQLNVTYKAYLHGSYYSTRSFNAFSSIEINCEVFHANPSPVYTLVWMLNDRNQTLFNQSKQGRYFITNATWRNRGIYMCFAENDLNNAQPVHQSFRLNIWFHEHYSKADQHFALANITFSSKTFPFKFIIVILIFLITCLLFLLSLYCFCAQMKSLIA